MQDSHSTRGRDDDVSRTTGGEKTGKRIVILSGRAVDERPLVVCFSGATGKFYDRDASRFN
ncbi:hypothetical protein [Burkholderia cepacia]|uniref:hypothetical protein n=1 Tax=Burkholderia cepacia TaxID=292 RepID=UPI0018AF6019|nr:hypothetical protein [Burkholderia cepacia]